MKNSVRLFLAAAMLTGLFAASFAEANTFDVVRDIRGGVVCSQYDCVRTKWENDYDACTMPRAAMMGQNAKVYFASGSSKLSAESKKTLDMVVADIKAAKGKVAGVRIAGFADKIGSAVKNEKLSKKRADAVRKYLVAKGVTGAQVLETRWFGDTMAAASCPADMKKPALNKCLQEDRRVEVEIDYDLTR